MIGVCSSGCLGKKNEKIEANNHYDESQTAITEANAQKDFKEYLGLLCSESNSADIKYCFKNVDSDEISELLILDSGGNFKVCNYDGTIAQVGKYQFKHSPYMYYSKNPSYPGVLYVTSENGNKVSGYMSVNNNTVAFNKLDETSSVTDTDVSGTGAKLNNSQLLEELKEAEECNQVIEFIAFPEKD